MWFPWFSKSYFKRGAPPLPTTIVANSARQKQNQEDFCIGADIMYSVKLYYGSTPVLRITLVLSMSFTAALALVAKTRRITQLSS